MNLTILGCSGGVAPQKGTTCFLVDDDILIDAGTGLESLTLPEMAKITHLFITHAHLDHISHLPFLLNNLIGELDFTLHVYASSFTIQALRQHIFNDVIWPDFTQLPNKEYPCVVLHPFEVGDSMAVGERRIVALPAEHSIPTMGFWVGELEGKGHFAFTGDCSSNFKFWQALQELPEVEALIVDDQYLEAEKEISLLAKHYYPAALKSDLKQLSYHPKLYLTHLPAYKSEEVWAEAQTVLAEWHPIPLESGMQLHFDASN